MKFKQFIPLSLFLFILLACSNAHPIIGKWKLDDINLEKAIVALPNEQKDMARKMLNSAFLQVKGKMKLEFTKDSKFKIETPIQEGKINIENGSYTLSKDNKSLTTIVEGKSETIGVISLSSKKLVLSMPSPGQGEMQMIFVPQ